MLEDACIEKPVKPIAWGVIYIMFFNGISMHFDENRTLATQIGTLGASIGQFALPVIITASITGYSLQATVGTIRLTEIFSLKIMIVLNP